MNNLPIILAVDQNSRNLELLDQFLSQEGYQVLRASTLSELNRQMAIAPTPVRLVLIDISGFNQAIWQGCEQLRAEGIPFLVISPRQSMAIQQQGLARGASSVLVKPLVLQPFLELIRSLII
jgi:DNA-binding response OmpR family regulator